MHARGLLLERLLRRDSSRIANNNKKIIIQEAAFGCLQGRQVAFGGRPGARAWRRILSEEAHRDGADALNVKTGRGGIRDVEFAIQFLQLLNGGALKQLRTGNTLEAVVLLEQSGCLTFQERTILEENYAFLRKIEHRLQIMFDLQTHLLPAQKEEQAKVAIRMGYTGTPHISTQQPENELIMYKYFTGYKYLIDMPAWPVWSWLGII